MVTNGLWRWLDQGGWKKINRQHKGKPVWAAELKKDITGQIEKVAVKVHYVDAHVPRSWAAEKHHNNGLVDWAVKIKVSQETWTGSIGVNYFQSVGPEHIRLSGKRCNIKMGS